MKFFGTFEGEKFEDYAKAIDEWTASCKRLANETLKINDCDGNLKIQPGNPDGSIGMNLSDKIKSISKEFKKRGGYVKDGLIDGLAVSEAYKQYKEKNDPESKSSLKQIICDIKNCDEPGERINMIVPAPNDTDEISRIIHMSIEDAVDILDDMASEMDAEISGSSIDELKEKLPYLVALRKSIKLINGLKLLTNDWEKSCR